MLFFSGFFSELLDLSSKKFDNLTAILSLIFTVTYSNCDLFSSVITVSVSPSLLSKAQSLISPIVEQPVSVKKDTNRNEKVMITNGSQTKELKWKKAKPLVESGKWTRV